MIRRLVLALALATAGCLSLDSIPQHECGNHVVEDSEDCDGELEPGLDLCSDDCTWQCATAVCPEGWSYDAFGDCCPAGYACGSDARCHAPSGTFHPVSGGAFSVDTLTLAQLDAQRGLEIIGLSDSAIDVVQLGATGAVVATQEVPVSAASAWSTGPLEGDGDQTAELLGSIGPGALAFHAPTGPLETFPFTTFVIPDSQVLTDQASRVALLPNADPEPIIVAARQDSMCATGTGVCAELITELGDLHGFPCDDAGFMPTDVIGDRLGIRAIAGGDSLFALGLQSATRARACVYVASSTVPPDPQGVVLGAPTILDLPPGYSLLHRGAMVFARVPGDTCPSLLVPLDDGIGLGIVGFARGSGSPCRIDPTVVVLDNTMAMVPLFAGQIDGAGGDEVVTDTGVFPLVPGSPPEIPYAPLAFTPRSWHSVAIGDINRDGLIDVVGSAAAVEDGSDGDDIDVLRQRPDGMFATSKVFTANLVDQVRIGDVDGDLYDDIVFVEIDADHDAEVEVAFGAPAGGAPEVVHAASFPAFDGMTTVDDVLEGAALDDDGTADLIVATFSGGTVLYGSFTRHLLAPLVLATPVSISYVTGTAIIDIDHQYGAEPVLLAQNLSTPFGPPPAITQVIILLAGPTAGRYSDRPVEISAGDLTSIADGNGVFTAATFQGEPILLGIAHGAPQAPPVVQGFAIAIDPGPPVSGTETLIGNVVVGGDKPATAPWGVEAVHVTDVDLDGDPDLLVDFAHTGDTATRTTWLIQLHLDPASHLVGTATEVRSLDTQCETSAAIELDPTASGRELVGGCAGQVIAIAAGRALDDNDFRAIDQIVAGDVTGDGVDDLVMLRDVGTERAELQVLVQCTSRDPAACVQAGTGMK